MIAVLITDSDFWERLPSSGQMEIVLLTMPDHEANLSVARRLAARSFPGVIAATAQFPDELAELRECGVHEAFNFYAEAGAGFAEHVCDRIKERRR